MAAIDFSDLGDFDSESIDKGGAPAPGKAHLLVSSVEDKGDYLVITSEIVGHEDPTQVGKREYNTLNKAGKGSKRSLLFALAVGLITKQDIADAQASGSSIDIDFDDAYSRTYLGTLVHSVYNGKPKCRVEWDYRRVDDVEAENYPVNGEYLAPEPAAAAAPAPAPAPAKNTQPVTRRGTAPGTRKQTTDADIPF